MKTVNKQKLSLPQKAVVKQKLSLAQKAVVASVARVARLMRNDFASG